ncbi:MAG: exodeoxyribonuclease VII large subunit, partial [Candidatus Omnitrophota bacterium]
MKELFSFSNKIYSVSEITRQINVLLEEAYSYVYIEGEISNCKPHSSGHIYFSIKDKDSILSCVMFKHKAYKLKFNLEDGMRVVASGKIGVYEKRGQYQLYADRIEPKGVGALQVAFEQLKVKLSSEGLFDETVKKQIPFFPGRIGIVTSPTGAAIKDILHTIFKRVPNMHIILYPARVQGEGAAEEIAAGIESFNKLKNVDVIIFGRGGGSLEDLWPFNEEVVARAVFSS